MFWIEFDKTVEEADILNFMKQHLTPLGTFVSCGRFAKRIIGYYDECRKYRLEKDGMLVLFFRHARGCRCRPARVEAGME